MLSVNAGSTDQLVNPDDPIAVWASRAWRAACARFDDERVAGAAALLRAAGRVILAGSGRGLDAARFGQLALREAGFDARVIHAAELAAGTLDLEPSDVVVGIDTGDQYLPGALARARSLGLRTLGLTDQDLTLIDCDVLAQYADPEGGPHRAGRSPLPICAYLSLLVARVEPSSQLAFESATFGSQFGRLAGERALATEATAVQSASAGRIVLCGAGPTSWPSTGIARRINSLDTGATALTVHLAELSSGWQPRPEDLLLILEPPGWSGSATDDLRRHRGHIWRIGGAADGAAPHTRLRAQSPALASISAGFVLELFLDELIPRHSPDV